MMTMIFGRCPDGAGCQRLIADDLIDSLHVVLDAWPWLRWERTFVLDLLLAYFFRRLFLDATFIGIFSHLSLRGLRVELQVRRQWRRLFRRRSIRH